MIIRSKLIPVALLSLGAIGAWPGAASSAPSQADIPYATSATGEQLKLDLYLPEQKTGAPLLVWLHGGGWENGNKSAMPLAPIIARGFAVASLDFSPASKAKFPGQVHEIKAGIRFLRAEASRYGYDASRIAIMGASSGAHLAAVVGTGNRSAELEGTIGDHRDQSSEV